MSTLVFNESEHDPIGVPVSFPKTLLNVGISRETSSLTHIKDFQSAAFKKKWISHKEWSNILSFYNSFHTVDTTEVQYTEMSQ